MSADSPEVDRAQALALRGALSLVGATVGSSSTRVRRNGRQIDEVLEINGTPIDVEYKGIVTRAEAHRFTQRPGVLLVADRIPKAAQQELRDAGVNFYDLRGHLRLVAPGLFIDAELPSPPGAKPDTELSMNSETVIEAAIAIMESPDEPMGIRKIARTIGRSPSGVSAAVKQLAGAGLVLTDNTPLIPDLFWEIAARWDRRATPLATLPDDSHLLSRPASNHSWVLTDTVAAAAWGMPVVATPGYPPDFLVATRRDLDRAVATLRRCPPEERACTVAAAPARYASTPNRIGRSAGGWALASHVVVALDLGQDRARGREIIENWQPPEGIVRAW